MNLKEALAYLVGLKDNKTYNIGGVDYSDNRLVQVEPERYYPETKTVGSLDAIAKMIRAELQFYGKGSRPGAPTFVRKAGVPLFVHVASPTIVRVFSRMDDHCKRDTLYAAVANDVEFKDGWRDQQEAIIEVRSRFLPTEDSEYLLSLISSINQEEGIKSTDNGVSQTVVVKTGVSLQDTATVKPRLELQPFRTFLEVEQPVSEFILRLDDKGRVGIFEADGGIWKLEAKDKIYNWLSAELDAEVESGCVVVMT